MSMIGVSISSNKSLQFEATDRAIVKLNLLLIDDKRHELGDYSISDLHVMERGIEKAADDFLAGLNEQTITA